MVGFLRDQGAQAGEGSNIDAITLCFAAARGDVDGLQESLLSRGLNANACDYDRRTAMHLAASEGHIAVLRLLVEEGGADLNPLDRRGNTPLDDAVREKREGAIAYLRQAGARGQALPRRPSFIASGEILKEKLSAGSPAKRFSPFRPKRSGYASAPAVATPSPTRSAAATPAPTPNGSLHAGTVWPLVTTSGAPASSESASPWRSPAGVRPSPKPPEKRHSFSNLLIEGGERISTAEQSVKKWTPGRRREVSPGSKRLRRVTGSWRLSPEAMAVRQLCAAASNGDIDSLRSILATGVSVNCSDYDHRTPLHLAASEGLLPVVVFLLEDAGAEHSPVDRWGGTPLDDAVRSTQEFMQKGRQQTGAGVLQAGAGVGGMGLRRGARPPSPVELAESFGHDVMAYLRARGARRGLSAKDEAAMLCSAAHEGWEAGLRELIFTMGLSPDLGDYDGRTAMHLAASTGHLGLLRFLVEEAGAAVSPRDRWDATPLDDAIVHGASQHVTYLWSRGGELGRPERNARSLELLAGASVFATRFGEVVLMEAPHMAAGGTSLVPHAHPQVTRKGWLHKVKRGGMAATWQKRYFALAGSSLYYAADPDVLQADPKLFCELGDPQRPFEVMLAPSPVRGHSHVFAIVIGAGATTATGSAPVDAGFASAPVTMAEAEAAGRQQEVLLLQADSVDEREAWATAIAAAQPQPPCRQIALAGLLTYHQLAVGDRHRGGGFAAVYRYETRAEPSGAPFLLAGPGEGEPQVARGRWAERCLSCIPMTHSLDATGREQFATDAAEVAQWLIGPIENAIAQFRRTLAWSTL